MTNPQRDRLDIINEIGQDWLDREKARLVSYGVFNLGMPRKEAQDLAENTIDDMLNLAVERKAKGLAWRTMFKQPEKSDPFTF